MTIEKGVLPYVLKTDTCWFWERSHSGNGRPYYRNKLVYRILFEHFRGPIPENLVLDHVVCNNPKCVNPWHTEPRTQKENLSRISIAKNFGEYSKKGNTLSGRNLGEYLGQRNRSRDDLGRFVGG